MANILTGLPLLTFTFCWACELCVPSSFTLKRLQALYTDCHPLSKHYKLTLLRGMLVAAIKKKKIGLHCVWHIHHFSQLHERASWKWVVQHCHTGVVKHAWKHLFGIFAYCSPFIQHTGKQMWLHIPPHYDMQMTLYCWFLVSITFTDWEKSVKTCTAGVL